VNLAAVLAGTSQPAPVSVSYNAPIDGVIPVASIWGTESAGTLLSTLGAGHVDYGDELFDSVFSGTWQDP